MTSSLYLMLHEDFWSVIDLSYKAVSGMGMLDPTKAKNKFLKLKNNFVYVRNNYEKSGNDEGYLRKGYDSIEFEQIDGSD